MSYVTRKIKAQRERGRRLANARWDKDRAMRSRLAAIEPSQFTGAIVRRIVVIDREASAFEITFYDFDNYTDRRRKLREVRALAEFPKTHVDSANATL